MGHNRLTRRRRLVRPDRIQRIVFLRHQHGVDRGQLGRQGSNLRLAVQPGVVAELAAGGQFRRQPGAGRLVGDMNGAEQPGIDLLADLEGIAPVDEDRRFVQQHRGQTGRTGKAGQPSQTLGMGRYILALMLVAARHQKAVQAAAAQFRAQCR